MNVNFQIPIPQSRMQQFCEIKSQKSKGWGEEPSGGEQEGSGRQGKTPGHLSAQFHSRESRRLPQDSTHAVRHQETSTQGAPSLGPQGAQARREDRNEQLQWRM